MKDEIKEYTHDEVIDLLDFPELCTDSFSKDMLSSCSKLFSKDALNQIVEFPFSEKYSKRGDIDIYDEIVHKFGSARRISDYNEGYYDALKFVLGMLNHNRKLEQERKHNPDVGDKYICYDVMSLVDHDNYYEGQYEEDKLYTIAMRGRNVVIFEGMGIAGIYVDDVKKFFRRVNE